MARPIMNIKKAKKVLEKFFSDWDITVEYDLTDERLTAKSRNVNAKPYDDDIFISILIYPSGFVAYNFYFDYLTKNAQVLDLLNSFNENVIGLKASVSNEDGGLTITHEAEAVTEDVIDIYTNRVLNDLLDDDTVKYLLPLTELTSAKD